MLGLLQGLALYALYQAGSEETGLATQSYWFVPLLLLALFVPLLCIASIGTLSGRQTAAWCLSAALLLVGLGAYDVWRSDVGAATESVVRYPQPELLIDLLWGFFVAHSLVVAGVAERRRIASYPAYFEASWKLLLQCLFSVLFVCVLWLVLWLGEFLFGLLGLEAPERLLQEAWFAIPVTMFSISCALHITDVRPAMVRGMRTLLLNLLSWVLPLATVTVSCFLMVLPWTGLAPLWDTGHASWVVLGAIMALLLLINATVQDGSLDTTPHLLLRWSARMAALCLLPLLMIAAYAMALRVADYGWTRERISGSACLGIVACYATGYALAAMQRQHWVQRLGQVNVMTTFASLVLSFLLLSPLADPARLAVQSQIARLESGRVAPDKFDYDYLRFSSARYGREALERLRTTEFGDTTALVRQSATQALARSQPGNHNAKPLSALQRARQLHVWPPGAALPESFLAQDWSSTRQTRHIPACLRTFDNVCDVYLQQGKPGAAVTLVLVIDREHYEGGALLHEREPGVWDIVGTVPSQATKCQALQQQLQAGAPWDLAPSNQQDLLIGTQRLALQPLPNTDADCPAFAP
jgi:hypothetical protein